MEKIRLQKYLADCGIASRRQAEVFIAQGKVTVNGEVVRALGTKVGPRDKVEFKGHVAKPERKKVYIMLNKPVGYLSTVKKGKEKGKTVLELVKGSARVFPVGRLDKESSGLLILTNDGDLALKLTHPRYEKEKEYEVAITRPLTDEFLKKMRSGVKIDGKKTSPAKVIPRGVKKFNIILKEGRKRQIRRMCEALGCGVISLRRIRINKLTLGDLKMGNCRNLTEKEVNLLK
ncbi:MAG: pseudouridine synthase [Patescibacteria group bacterium]